jgi:hypothetical protein
MKQTTRRLLVAMCALTTHLSYAQDKIVMRNGDTLTVNISRSTPDLVEFTYLGETAVSQEYKNAIARIIHQGGRVEECSSKTLLADIQGKDDWAKVVITYTESDVKGLTKVGQITAASGWGGAMASGLGYNQALKKIKKRAAGKKASIVWITDKPNEHSVASGAGVKLTGIAYR